MLSTLCRYAIHRGVMEENPATALHLPRRKGANRRQRKVILWDQPFVDAFLQIAGFDREEVIGTSWRELTPEPHHMSSERAVAELAKRGVTTPYEKEYYRKDGSRWWGLFAARRISEDEVVEFVLDVTEQKQVEQNLQELNETLEERVAERTWQVHELSRRLTMAEQEERHRIAQILHDDLQQLIYGIQMKMSFIGGDVEAGREASARQHLEETDAWVRQAVNVTRQLTVDLSPPILQGEGLADAMQWLVRQMGELHGLEVALEAEHAFVIKDEGLRVLLFQSVRELLFNVSKHAETPRALVRLEQSDQQIVIHVIDEGEGFDLKAAEHREHTDGGTGLGLFRVRERIRLVGGQVEIETAPGAGTHVTIVAPLSRGAADAREASA